MDITTITNGSDPYRDSFQGPASIRFLSTETVQTKQYVVLARKTRVSIVFFLSKYHDGCRWLARRRCCVPCHNHKASCRPELALGVSRAVASPCQSQPRQVALWPPLTLSRFLDVAQGTLSSSMAGGYSVSSSESLGPVPGSKC